MSRDKWCKARGGMNPCEACKEFINAGDWYWGVSYARWCYDCAPAVATCDPPELAYVMVRWVPERQKYLMTARAWGGGPIQPPCEQPCPEHADDLTSCPFQTCPMRS